VPASVESCVERDSKQLSKHMQLHMHIVVFSEAFLIISDHYLSIASD
jgi:hypothetical protein